MTENFSIYVSDSEIAEFCKKLQSEKSLSSVVNNLLKNELKKQKDVRDLKKAIHDLKNKYKKEELSLLSSLENAVKRNTIWLENVKESVYDHHTKNPMVNFNEWIANIINIYSERADITKEESKNIIDNLVKEVKDGIKV